MISFKEFLLLESPSGNYVSVGVTTPIEIRGLQEFCKECSVTPANKQHVTLMYSKGTSVPKRKILEVLRDWKHEIDVNTGDLAAFDSPAKEGERDSSTCAIVLKLESELLHEIHNQLKEIDLIHSYDEFSPHVTIAYGVPIDRKQEVMDFIKKNLDMSTITLRNWIVQPIDENWAKKLK